MKQRLATAPVWILYLINTTIASIIWLAPSLDVGRAIGIGVVVGGAMTAVQTSSRRKPTPAAFSALPRASWQLVRDAAWHGPVPADPAVRRAACELADRDRAKLVTDRIWLIPVSLLLIGVFLSLAVTDRVSWALPAVLLCIPLAVVVLWPVHLSRRINALQP